MIISETPLRISFVGGGTDFKDFYRESYGAVLSCTIDKYVYVIVKERYDDHIVLNYSKKEIVDSIDDIRHDLIRESLKIVNIHRGVEITTLADIPSEGSGLGSSSSITVGLLNALYCFTGRQVSAEKLAQEACNIEIEILKKPIGKQDQYIAAYGGLNEIIFYPDEKVAVNKINIKDNAIRKLGSNIHLYFTGITRKSESILAEQKCKIREKFKLLTLMSEQVKRAKNYIINNDFNAFGELLNEGWNIKKQLAGNITNPEIDDMYTRGLAAGALGGKISGAGGGGFLLLYIPRIDQESVREELIQYREFPFMIEPFGTKIIMNMGRKYWK